MVWLAIKSGSIHHIFFKCPMYQVRNMAIVPKKAVSMYVGVCFYCISVFLLFRCFPLIVDVFRSVLVCNLDLFSLNRFMTFGQWYTTVALLNFHQKKKKKTIFYKVIDVSKIYMYVTLWLIYIFVHFFFNQNKKQPLWYIKETQTFPHLSYEFVS